MNKKVMILSSLKKNVANVVNLVEKQIIFKTKSGCKICNGKK